MYQTLFERYPELFPQKGVEVPFNDWGFELPNSDYPLMEAMCRALYHKVYNAKTNLKYLERCKESDPERYKEAEEHLEKCLKELPVFAQIKTKFGGLRIYIDNASEYADGIINMTENIYEIFKESSRNKKPED